jgi:hypothetical protein
MSKLNFKNKKIILIYLQIKNIHYIINKNAINARDGVGSLLRFPCQIFAIPHAKHW